MTNETRWAFSTWTPERECDSISEADRGSAYAVGQNHPDWPWILSDRDVWYPNPAYRGPRVPHPEDCEPDIDQPATATPEEIDRCHDEALAVEARAAAHKTAMLAPDNCPF